MTHAIPSLLAASLLLAAAPARTAPEEIQVYLDDLNAPGRFGLDVHTNLVATGETLGDYAGEQQSRHRLRITPEFALGLSRYLEAGLYLPLTTIDGRGRIGLDGAKVRLKYIAPKAAGQSWFWGANVEVGVVNRGLDSNPWNTEIKGIVGRRWGPWTLAVNGNLDVKLSGPESAPPSLEIDTRLTYALNPTLSLGVETYNGAGELRRLGAFGSAEQSSFIVADKSFGRWDLELGAGAGYGANRDGLILKAIIGVPID
jgi:hypothetical protein